ncbi:MAG: bifunctional riboflavin kinase/FAD synthetase [Parachlamydiaceae bacterium]|nr:bifunctional riboflavin kinase/FAD synthetase [Parachlamydiaceae bacterium]
MEILTSLNFSKSSFPYVLTIGNFDGLHLGHKSVLDRLKIIAKQKSAQTAVLTFSNHPANVINKSPTPLLCTLEHKVQLLEKEDIDLLILIPFSPEVAVQSAATFLAGIKKALPFEVLVLGNDATLGKNKEGNREAVEVISKEQDFEVEYLGDYSIDDMRISSSKIRACIREGNLVQAAQMFGRPYSIYAPITKGAGRGSQIGFPTANIAVNDLCLPPLGVYAVTLKHLDNKYYGVANLGYAPTLRHDLKTIFEVHLFNYNSDLYGEPVEVIFNKYIRPEQRFDGIEQLKEQIGKDIQTAKYIHGI